MDFNFYFLSTTVVWDPLFFWSTSYELWAQHYHQLISLWGTAHFQKSTAKRWESPLKYIVISCQTHRAKPKLSLSACTPCCNPQAHPQHQRILRPICPKKTRPGVLQLMNRKYLGAQPQERFLPVGPGRHLAWTHLRVLLVPAIEGMRTDLPHHNTLLPQGTQSFYGWSVSSVSIDCAALRQSNNRDCRWQGTGSSQHTCKGSKGYHTAGSVTPCDNRLARQAELFL